MNGAGAEPDARSRIERAGVLSGTDPGPCAVAPLIASDIDAWALDRRRRNLRNIDADRKRLEFIAATCAWGSLEAATPESFLGFLAHMRRPVAPGEKVKGKKGRIPWKGATCNREQTRLSGLFDDAARRRPERRLLNWAKALPRADTDDSDEGSRAITWEEFSKLVRWVRRRKAARADAYIVMGYTGLRFEEGRALQIAEVMLEGVPRLTLTKRTKGKKRRTIPLRGEGLDVVRRLVGKRKDGRVFAVFPSIRTLQRDCRKSGIGDQDIGYHSLRKCFAGRCATTGVSLQAAQKMLGHSDPKLTANIYAHFADGDLAEEVGRLGALLLSCPQGGSARGKQNLTRPSALGDTVGVEAFDPMTSTPATSRSPAPGRTPAGHGTPQHRASAVFRPGTSDRDRTEPCQSRAGKASAKSHLRDLNSRPMLYESTGPGESSLAEAIADACDHMARFLRRGAHRAQQRDQAG